MGSDTELAEMVWGQFWVQEMSRWKRAYGKSRG